MVVVVKLHVVDVTPFLIDSLKQCEDNNGDRGAGGSNNWQSVRQSDRLSNDI